MTKCYGISSSPTFQKLLESGDPLGYLSSLEAAKRRDYG
jgi:hypothetical protein